MSSGLHPKDLFMLRVAPTESKRPFTERFFTVVKSDIFLLVIGCLLSVASGIYCVMKSRTGFNSVSDELLLLSPEDRELYSKPLPPVPTIEQVPITWSPVGIKSARFTATNAATAVTVGVIIGSAIDKQQNKVKEQEKAEKDAPRIEAYYLFLNPQVPRQRELKAKFAEKNKGSTMWWFGAILLFFVGVVCGGIAYMKWNKTWDSALRSIA